MSISFQGVDPDASEGSSALEVSPPPYVNPDAAEGSSAPEVSPPGSRVLLASLSPPEPQELLGQSMGCLSSPPGDQDQACEHRAYEVMSNTPAGRLTSDALLQVLMLTPDIAPRRARGERSADSHHWFTGAYMHGPMVGVRNSTRSFPWTTALACRYVREKAPWHAFGALAFTVNVLSEPHVDSRNAETSCNLVLPVSSFEKGGIWIADDAGGVTREINGKSVRGNVHSFDKGGILFDPRLPHATERWEGDRAVLVAYMPGAMGQLETSDRSALTELGFALEPKPRPAEEPEVSFAIEFGIRWTEDEFVAEACKAEHPSSIATLLPPELESAIAKNFEWGAERMGQHRTETIRRWIAQANLLAQSEDALKGGMSENRRSILSRKRLLLFKSLIEEAGHEDHSLFDDLVHGFDLVGRLPESGFFKRRFKPATLLETDLRAGAARARTATLATVCASDDPVIDAGVLKATLKEVEAGYVEGPIPESDLPPEATLTRRFGVVQGEVDGEPKVRPIDNYRTSKVNAAVSQSEQVTVHTLDVIAGMLSSWLVKARRAKAQVPLAAKTWDLKTAYKQLALSDAAFRCDSFFVIFDPRFKKASIFKQRALPFGSRASVTAFIRTALAVWKIAVKILHLVWSVYFDDYLSVVRQTEAKHVDLVVSVFFRLLGWRVSEDKLIPYSSCCKVLGIELDVGNAVRGYILLKNTLKRRDEVIRSLEEVLANGSIDGPTLERLRGRAQFASGQLFGRLARQALHSLSDRPTKDLRLSGRFKWGAHLLISLLKDGRPRTVTRDLSENRFVFVDASYEPSGRSGVGGICYDASRNVLSWFGSEVPSSFLKVLQSCFGSERATVIFELEALAVAVSLELFAPLLSKRNVVMYTDNSGVHGAFVRCWSENEVGSALAFLAAKREFELQAFFYYDRVPSPSNPADAPSRFAYELPDALRAECTAVTLEKTLKCALEECHASSGAGQRGH